MSVQERPRKNANFGYRGGYLDGYAAGYRDASAGYKEALDKLANKEINWKSLHEYLDKTVHDRPLK